MPPLLPWKRYKLKDKWCWAIERTRSRQKLSCIFPRRPRFWTGRICGEPSRKAFWLRVPAKGKPNASSASSSMSCSSRCYGNCLVPANCLTKDRLSTAFDTPLKKGSHYELYGVQNIPNRGGTVCHRSSSSACDLVPCAQAAGEVGVNVTS
jgi:hypothetical protein